MTLFGTARTAAPPSAGQFGSARVANVPLAGQFGGIASSGPPVEIAAGNLRAWFTLQQADLVFQESTLTTASGDGDPIGGLVDWYGAIEPLIQATAAARPTKRDNGAGIKYAEFDGVDDIIRGATAATWKELHGPNGGGIYMVGEWTGASATGTFYIAGTSAAVVSSATNIGLRGLIRDTASVDRPVVTLGDGSAFTQDDGVSDSWEASTVRMAYYENDTGSTVVRVNAEPATEQSTSSAAVTPSTSDGGSLFVTSNATAVFHLYEIVVRSPILTSTEYDALKAYWNTTYSLGL